MKRSDGTEKKIIQAALKLFARKGYHGTALSEITESVGLTKGALYARFSGKSELFMRIIDEFKTRFVGQMIKHLEQCTGNALDKIIDTLQRMVSQRKSFPDNFS